MGRPEVELRDRVLLWWPAVTPSLWPRSKLGMIGVYAIVNIQNGNLYIGSTVDLLHRAEDHFRNLRRGTHRNEHLQKAFRKYGECSFCLTVLEAGVAQADLLGI